MSKLAPSLMLDFGGTGERRLEAIPGHEAHRYLLDGHYAKRLPSISYAWGLFRGPQMDGVVCYGTPASAPLRSGVCGPNMADRVLELNRLFLVENRKFDAGWLVAHSLRLLPRPSVVVSYADTSQGHVGTVYRATNWIYCGLSEKRTDWTIRGREHLHGHTIADEFRGSANRAQSMREKYGDDFFLRPRPRKHRFVFFVGSHKERREMRAQLRWQAQEAAA